MRPQGPSVSVEEGCQDRCQRRCPVCPPQGVCVEEANGSPPVSTPNEETSRHYGTLLDQEELQQELVVTAIKVKKRSRRQQGRRTLGGLDRPERGGTADQLLCSGSSLADGSPHGGLSDSSSSDSAAVAQQGSCSGAASANPLSEQALLVPVDLQDPFCPEHEEDPRSKEAKYGSAALQRCCRLPLAPDSVVFCPRSVCEESLRLQSLEEERKPKGSADSASEAVPVTPDVDLLLQCSFSYMLQGAECEEQEQKPEEGCLEATGPEDEEEVLFFPTCHM